eukprot:6445616-Heterocapsa_arctica.AAC.1
MAPTSSPYRARSWSCVARSSSARSAAVTARSAVASCTVLHMELLVRNRHGFATTVAGYDCFGLFTVGPTMLRMG